MRPVFANAGFISQMAGIFLIIPVIVSFIYKETDATIALLITATIFLALGFFLNSLCERKELGFKQSSMLIILSFVLLSLIGSIPYFYIDATNAGGLGARMTDSMFESLSGYTTTGFSVISDPSSLPKSIILYRGLTQFIGGIGIVLILLVFFYSEDKLESFARSMGLSKNDKIKKTFIIITLMYIAFFLAIGFLSFLFGYRDLVTLASYLFASTSGGGLSPVTNMMPEVAGTPLGFFLIIAMILGASNFVIIAGLFRLKVKEFIRSEVAAFIILLISSFLLIKIFFNLGFFDSLFHVTSAMTNTGFSYLPLGDLGDSFKIFLITLMVIGGTSLSAAGGIKVYRFLLLLKSVKKSVHESITQEEKKITLFGKEYSNQEVIQNLITIMLIVGAVFASAIIFDASGYGFVDSLFVSSSAVATTGLDVGITGAALGIGLKWLLIALMLLGRVEVFAFLIMFSRAKEKEKPVAQAA